MTFIVICTLLCVVLAAAVLGYTAFPHRDAPTPGAPWLDSALGRVRDAVPVIADGDLDARDDRDDRDDRPAEREPEPATRRA